MLFVGTKRQATETIEREASRCQMPFISDRWLGGTLTNFRTIRSRLGRLEELEQIRSGEELATYSKKMQSSLNREYRKMYRNLNGMRNMNRLPECVFVVDPRKEKNAIREAQKLGITTIALIDTDCDPDVVDLPIPGNDDGIRSIELIVSLLADARRWPVAPRHRRPRTADKAAAKATAEQPRRKQPRRKQPTRPASRQRPSSRPIPRTAWAAFRAARPVQGDAACGSSQPFDSRAELADVDRVPMALNCVPGPAQSPPHHTAVARDRGEHPQA